MIRHSPADLLRLDKRVDRCDNCGGWRFDRWCQLCNEPEEQTA